MDNVLSARALMGISLGFHIVYATIGIKLPFMLMIAEWLSLRSGDELYHRLARHVGSTDERREFRHQLVKRGN